MFCSEHSILHPVRLGHQGTSGSNERGKVTVCLNLPASMPLHGAVSYCTPFSLLAMRIGELMGASSFSAQEAAEEPTVSALSSFGGVSNDICPAAAGMGMWKA